MAVDFGEPWHCDGPSRSLEACSPKQKPMCWLHIMVLSISLPYLDWLGVDRDIAALTISLLSHC